MFEYGTPLSLVATSMGESVHDGEYVTALSAHRAGRENANIVSYLYDWLLGQDSNLEPFG